LRICRVTYGNRAQTITGITPGRLRHSPFAVIALERWDLRPVTNLTPPDNTPGDKQNATQQKTLDGSGTRVVTPTPFVFEALSCWTSVGSTSPNAKAANIVMAAAQKSTVLNLNIISFFSTLDAR
jgi:hypothetical protein